MAVHEVPAEARVTLIVLGFGATVAQAVVVREAMAALAGSEMAWGAVLGVWLLGMGGGAWLGSERGGRRLARAGPLLVVLSCGAAVLVIRAAPRLLAVTAGETLTTWQGLGLLTLAVFPVAVVGGVTFPVAAQRRGGSGAAAAAYADESLGAMVGGVAFTFLLAPLGSGGALVVGAAVAAMALFALSRKPLLALASLLVAVATTVPAERLLAELSWRWSGRQGALVGEVETRQERLEIGDGASPTVWADGRLLRPLGMEGPATGRVATALLSLPRAERVIVAASPWDERLAAVALVSGAPAALIVEDRGILAAARLAGGRDGDSGPALAGARALVGEPLRAIERSGPWDAIVLLDGDPTTLRRDRTRTVEFFRACRGALAASGGVVVEVGVGDTYLGGTGGRLLAVVRATLAEVFPTVVAIPGDRVLLVAARDRSGVTLDEAVLRQRWGRRPADVRIFDPVLLPMLLDAERAGPLNAFLAARRETPNTVRRPRAVLLATALHEGRGRPPLLIAARALLDASRAWLLLPVVAAAAWLIARGCLGAPLGVELASVVGFSSMAWWLLLLAGWQSTLGSVYAEIGVLSAAFMAGLVGGATVARRREWTSGSALVVVLAVGALLSLVLSAGLPLVAPRAAVVPLLVVSGALTGAAFPAVAARAGGGDVRRGAGRGFGADEIGAALAAMVVGLVLLPWAGFAATAACVAALQAAGVAAVALAKPPRAS